MKKMVFRSAPGAVRAIMIILICSVIFSATAQEEESLGAAPGAQESFAAAVQSLFDRYSQAIVDGNADAWIALWDEEGIQMPPGNPAVAGKDAIREHNMPLFMEPLPAFLINIEETNNTGDYGYARGTYSFPLPEPGANFDGKYLTIFHRQADGSWKIYRDCFNASFSPEDQAAD